jgi:hypothetical protein
MALRERFHLRFTIYARPGHASELRTRADPHSRFDSIAAGVIAISLSADGGHTRDFYGAYDPLDCPKQKCLTHLLREIKNESEKDEAFAGDAWVVTLMAWCKKAIAHKKKWKTLDDAKYEPAASRLGDRLDELIRIDPAHALASWLPVRIDRAPRRT